MILDPDTINLIKTMAFCKTEKMKHIKEKVMQFWGANSATQFCVFMEELGLERIDEYIEAIIKIVIDTWMVWYASENHIKEQTESTIYLYPEMELVRFGQRPIVKRDWRKRWLEAAESVGWIGVRKGKRMIARKDSPIWAALGNGAGGYDDCWGLPYPPFAIGSGMDWLEPD